MSFGASEATSAGLHLLPIASFLHQIQENRFFEFALLYTE